jgi:hypothetical protein
MFKPNLTKAQLHEIIEGMSHLDVARFLYRQEMAGAYLAVGKFEDMLVSAMHMCDRVKLEKVLGPDKGRLGAVLGQASSIARLHARLVDQNPVPEPLLPDGRVAQQWRHPR